MGDQILKRSIPAACIFLATLVLLCGLCSCGGSGSRITTSSLSTYTPTAGGPLEYVPKPLVFTVGEYSSTQLDANGGDPPYQYRLKAGVFLPSGFSLSARGVLSGKAPDLETGVAEINTEPFTILIKDSEGTQIETEIVLTYIKP